MKAVFGQVTALNTDSGGMFRYIMQLSDVSLIGAGSNIGLINLAQERMTLGLFRLHFW